MVNLNKEEKKEEIKRLEERSLFYLKFFPAFWFAVIFFIVREITNNEAANKISLNFMNNIFDFTTFQGVLASLGFYILLLLIPFTIMALSMINVRGILSYQKDKKPFDKLLDEKYNDLMGCLRYGFFASILLVAYLVYLFFIDNQLFTSKLEVIGKMVVFLVTFMVLFLGPLVSFIVNIKKWKRIDFLKRITEILGVFFSIVYFIKPLMLLFFRNEYLAFSGIILFLIIFPINFYRFFHLSLRKIFLYGGKVFKNGRQK